MSLAERRETAKKEEAIKNSMPKGTYKVRLFDWKYGKSQKKKDMYTLCWKIRKPIKLEEDLPEGMEISDLKGKKRNTYYLPSENWSLIKLLDFLESAGANLEKYDDVVFYYGAIDDGRSVRRLFKRHHDSRQASSSKRCGSACRLARSSRHDGGNLTRSKVQRPKQKWVCSRDEHQTAGSLSRCPGRPLGERQVELWTQALRAHGGDLLGFLSRPRLR